MAADRADRMDSTDRTDRTDRTSEVGPNLEFDFRATSSTRSLTWQVPESLVRGVPFRCLLAGAGRPFRNARPASAKTLAKQLKPCVTYDAFISHDWQTSGWLKYASLLLLFNSQAAAIVTLVVSIAGGLLISYDLLPNTDWAICMGYLTFIVLLLFWQNIRDVCRKPKLAFMDKLTIPQEDEKLKEQCILGLAGFLQRSDKLVILWSESYIGRVWCVYEFAAFTRMHSEKAHVQAVPVAFPLLLLLHAAWWLAVNLVIYVVWNSLDLAMPIQILLCWCSIGLFFLIGFPLQSWAGRRLTRNLHSLTAQLSHFNVNEAKCACCSCGHVSSETGKKIPCDRELIYQSLQDWYGKDSNDLQAGLERFNTVVRNKLADQILQTWGGNAVPVKIFTYSVFSMHTPFLITRIPATLRHAQNESTTTVEFWIVVVRVLVSSWGCILAGMLIYTWACKTMWALAEKHDRCPVLMTATSMVLVMASLAMTLLLCILPVWVTPPDSLLPLLPFLIVMGLGLYLVNRRTLCIPSGSSQNGRQQKGDGKDPFEEAGWDTQSICSSFSI
eukprot:s64_g33.t1